MYTFMSSGVFPSLLTIVIIYKIIYLLSVACSAVRSRSEGATSVLLIPHSRCPSNYQVHLLHNVTPPPYRPLPGKSSEGLLPFHLRQFVTVLCVPYTVSQSPVRGNSGDSLHLCAPEGEDASPDGRR